MASAIFEEASNFEDICVQFTRRFSIEESFATTILLLARFLFYGEKFNHL